ncbi:phBC6A51 family helix-turn-helix protein [Psychrobacillus sp. FSL K6-1267]|uniref:phBC6A51 family helix-turn-helix protein n=1 Tax=Psychrobacillus sp. FSL K6-1267 TaxID=2921543 RepID=UPI0030F90B56
MSPTEKEFLEAELGPRKVKAANLLVAKELASPDYEGPKTLDAIAEEIGISRKTFWEWREQSDFAKYVSAISNEYLSKFRPLIYNQLIKSITATQPSMKAMDMYFKIEGLYNDKVTINNEFTQVGGESNEDLAKSLESLQKMKALKETEGK